MQKLQDRWMATSGHRKFRLQYQETNSIKKKKNREKLGKRCPPPPPMMNKKTLRLQVSKMSSVASRSDLNDAGASVSSGTIRRRLTDVGLKGRIPRKKKKKKRISIYSNAKRRQWATEHIRQMISGYKLCGVIKLKVSLFGND